MSQTLTISAPLAMAAVPSLLAIGGVVVGIALNGWLTTGIEVARLNAANDDKTARWLWLHGYRKTPHAGPEVTALPAVDQHVTGELLAVDGVDTETDAPHEDTDRPRWWATVAAFTVLAPVAFARRQLPALIAWWRRRRDERYLIGSGEQAVDPAQPLREVLAASGYELDEVSTEPAAMLEVAAEVPTAVEPEPVTIVRVNHRYRRPGDTGLFPLVKVVGNKAAGRHRAEPEMPAINVPAQRDGGDDL